jgi:Uma2 family endonuclease
MTLTSISTETKRLFSADEFEQIAQAGVFAEGERVELIDGEIICMSPIGPRHFAIVARLTELFVRRLPQRGQVFVQSTVRLSVRNEPEPDLGIATRRDDYYASGLPGPADILLLIEVAETSLAYDRVTKRDLYGRHTIAEYWLLDLNSDTLFVFRNPGPQGYGAPLELRRGDRIAPLAFPELEVAVNDLLG